MDNITLESVDAKIGKMEVNYSEALDSIWMLLAACLVFFMHSGFTLLEAGSVRVRNTQSVLVKNLLVVTVGFICWWACGWAFAYGIAEEGVNDIIGHAEFASQGFMEDKSKYRQWLFQAVFCATAGTIMSGAVAERIQLRGFTLMVIVLTGVLYPVVVYWGWSGEGVLNRPKEDSLEEKEMESIAGPPYLDFAGSGIVHLVGGVAALAAAAVVGPRHGRFDAGSEDFAPHNVPFIVLGTFFLWFGWYGFNPGSTASMKTQEDAFTAGIVAVNTTLAPCVAGLLVLFLRALLLPPKLLDIAGMCNGILAGLVSITAACAVVEPWEAAAIGAVGAVVFAGASQLLRFLKIDDVVDAAPVHGACGAWGVLAAGFFGNPDKGLGGNGLIYGGDQLRTQLIACLFIIVFVGASTVVMASFLRFAGWLRASESFQEEGADMVEHSPCRAYAQEATPEKA